MTGESERVAVVTGAGRGIGRAHALLLAARGTRVVVNDLPASNGGEDPAGAVVDEIRSAGGDAVAIPSDLSEWSGAEQLISDTVAHYGRLDAVINNAGMVRDRMLVNMSLDEWDSVIRVNLTATFAVTHFASGYWREKSKSGETVEARVINTSSGSGLYYNVGQTNYGAAKAGVAAFSMIAAAELQRYGITVNAIVPIASTRLTADLTVEATDAELPEHVAPLVVWLASPAARDVTGRVFNVSGGHISIVESWSAGPRVDGAGVWDVDDLGPVISELVAQARPAADLRGFVTQ
jgi:NAD(P)-dependent dehydrogenase (short-subunit alcohol dehydrogenase family)